MKYLITILLILITSVTFSYYLLNNPNFLPINDLGEYNWINIGTFLFLLATALFSLLNILIYSALSLIKEKEGRVENRKEEKEGEGENFKKKKFTNRERITLSFKFSLIITIGVFAVFTLNFFHILNWIWGASILLVVLIFTFII